MMASQNRMLPALRQDLRLHAGAHTENGVGTWLIYDPVRHRYFQISKDAFDLLSIWYEGPIVEFVERAERHLDRPVGVDELVELATFLQSNDLTLSPAGGDARSYAAQILRSRHGWLMRIVHGYLFFRIPLARPQRLLFATYPVVAPLYTRTALWLVLALTASGLYLASRQWEAFVATFLDFLSLEGAAIYGLSLLVVKSLHELGHAYTATRYGVRVNTMGVAFLVMMPMLYTDVTDAWRLQKRREKLAIDVAGIAVELALAGIATFLWAFLPDGPVRSVAFVVATTSWIMSLVVNLNPLMRFDGYYLLSDAWCMPNLQSRSNALAVWRLRETLFGLGAPRPEVVSPRKQTMLVVYAMSVWIYRLFLFIGIALLVYHFFFKVLGIVLFCIEILWFIVFPIWRELRMWWRMRGDIMKTKRSLVTGAVLAGLLLLGLVPWSGTVTVPAVMTAAQESQVFAPRPARVERVMVREGSAIESGAPLIMLSAPDLDFEIGQTQHRIRLAKARLDRIAGDSAELSQRAILAGELETHADKLAGLEAERDRLTVRAPHAGVVRDADSDLHPNQWIDQSAGLLRVVAPQAALAKAYVADDDLWRIEVSQQAVFVPEDPLQARRAGRVTDVSIAGSRTIDVPYLASVYGGPIPSDRRPDGEIRPRSGRYLVTVRLEDATPSRVTRGTLRIAGRAESIISAAWRRILQVLVRESAL